MGWKHSPSSEKLLPSPGKRLLPWREARACRGRGTGARGDLWPPGTCCSGDGLILPHDVIPVTLMTEGYIGKQDYGLVLQKAGGVRGDEVWGHP